MSEQQNTLKIHRLPFTQVPNDLLCSDKISVMAKALWCVFYSKPDNWTFYWKEIERNFKEGRDAVRKGKKQLEELGYLKSTQKKINSGKGLVFGGMEIELFPYPNQQIQPPSSNTENPYSRNSNTRDSDSTSSNSKKADTDKERKKKDLSNKDLVYISSIEDTKKYFSDNNLKSDPEEFWDFYEAIGWKKGKTKITNREAAIKSWERKHQEIFPEKHKITSDSSDSASIVEDKELKELRANFKRQLHWDYDIKDWHNYFGEIYRDDNKFKITAKSPKAADYKALLQNLNIQLQFNK